MSRFSCLRLVRYGQSDAPTIRALLLDVHDEVYEGSADPLAGRDVFAGFVDSWSSREAFACVVGYDRGEPVGYAYGAPLGQDTAWWETVTPPLPPEFTRETGVRTFALSELMVRGPWRGTGAAQAIHRELLGDRREERVTLLVHKAHHKVRALYEKWGYRTVGETVPFEGAPELCAMVLTHRHRPDASR
ncbi:MULTISPECIES: GNAT family N-acetyltransferase [unclassified Streptomyces]|uniref:GNAT family N-acetyltransferase n=1 Tax=unclassified Streptomyces TaxID=2593676 RepID=UPI000DDB6A2B|nr:MULTISPECIES: GNAT family N-acetyltransferase [unclassified Streptomyces]QZZ27585.1 GNAT family N-acetyltransferase [Streptomyces sp. ST1015]